jgi:hypothetical protein
MTNIYKQYPLKSTETPTRTIINKKTGEVEVYVSGQEVARRAARKAADRKAWAALFPGICN